MSIDMSTVECGGAVWIRHLCAGTPRQERAAACSGADE
jgi:hypothetical protein